MSSTLIQIPGYGNVLLDCGEGTFGQLARTFGIGDAADGQSVWHVLRELRCVFVSHAHGDHHIGLAGVLAMRRKVCFVRASDYGRADEPTRVSVRR